MVIDNLKQAINKENDLTGLIIHSDQGVLYQAHRFRNLLKENNIEQSMSRRGNCYDNAVMESFFATLKCEFVYINKFKTTDEFKYTGGTPFFIKKCYNYLIIYVKIEIIVITVILSLR